MRSNILHSRRHLLRLGALAAIGGRGSAMPRSAHAQSAREKLRGEVPRAYAPRAALPSGYPQDYERVLRAAEDEGQVLVRGTTDLQVARPLLDAFMQRFPRIELIYEEMGATELHHAFLHDREQSARRIGQARGSGARADLLWSSAMDLQASLVDKGYVQAWRSPESEALPAWAQWRDMLHATTWEPVAIVHRRDAFTGGTEPRSREEFTRAIERDAGRLSGRATTYDIERSGVGFLFAAVAARTMPAYWTMIRALGRTAVGGNAVATELSTEAMLRRLTRGEALVGIDLLGGYALRAARTDPALRVVFPSDGTVVASRVALVDSAAAHPNAARVLLDYMLSPDGQRAMARSSGLIALRGEPRAVGQSGEEGAEGLSVASMAAQLGGSARPIPLDDSLARWSSDDAWRTVVRQWKEALSR